MSFQLDLNQELKSLFDISDVLFLDVLDTNSERFSETISKADLEKQRIQRISKKNTKKTKTTTKNKTKCMAGLGTQQKKECCCSS